MCYLFCDRQPKLQLVRWASDATSAVLVKGFNSSSDAASLAAASSGGIGAGGGGMGGGGGGGGPPPYRDVESGGGQKAAGPLPRAAALVRTRVEPKTFFAGGDATLLSVPTRTVGQLRAVIVFCVCCTMDVGPSINLPSRPSIAECTLCATARQRRSWVPPACLPPC